MAAVRSGAGGIGGLPDTRWAAGCLPPTTPYPATPAAAPASPACPSTAGTPDGGPYHGMRRVALARCRFLARLHHITAAELDTPAGAAERLAAIDTVRRLIHDHHLTAEQLFGT